jgi:hypothetical protein
MAGTNFFTPISTVTSIALTDPNGLAMLASANTTGETQANTYQIGCILIRIDAGTWYVNSGTVAIPVWTIAGTGSTGASGFSGKSGFSGTSGYSGTSGTP